MACPRFVRFAPFVLVWLVAAGAVPAGLAGGGAAPDVRISQEILANRDAKARQAARLAAAGKTVPGPETLEWESAALYVTSRLSQAEKSALRADGVDVLPDAWVPALPGRHPHGYHLARIRYSALNKAAAHPRTVRIDTVEHRFFPANEISREATGVQDLHNAVAPGPFTGAGTIVAVGDSGLDVTHEDIPTPIKAYDVTTGSSVEQWSTDVANMVTGHGTHVTGTAVGRGTLSGGTYAGMAPQAGLLFYKIGNDEDARTTEMDMIKAVLHARSKGADVFNLSYGGFGPYMDGSSAICQAIDIGFESGMIAAISAGNSANDNRHYSVVLEPGTEHGPISMSFGNLGSEPFEDEIPLRVIWRDDEPGNEHVSLELRNPGEGDTFGLEARTTSTRETKSARYFLEPGVPHGESKTYEFRLSNTAEQGEAPRVHLYQARPGGGTFPGADKNYTVTRPADADSAVTVAAWVHRTQWVNWQGGNQSNNQPLGERATFSSIGPRIDGVLKPEIMAPGSVTISARDNDLTISNSRMISNDGVNDGSGPANYSISQGTSMAAPVVAGVLALLREAYPEARPAEIRQMLFESGSQAESPDTLVGHGLLDAVKAFEMGIEPLSDWLLVH